MLIIAGLPLEFVFFGLLALFAIGLLIAITADSLLGKSNRFEAGATKRKVPWSLIAVVVGPLMGLVFGWLGAMQETLPFDRQATFDETLYVTLFATAIATVALGVSDIVHFFRRPKS